MADHYFTEDQRRRLTDQAIESWAYISRYALHDSRAITGPFEQFAHVMAQLAGIELPLINPSTGTPVIDQASGQPIPQGDHPLGLTDAHIEFIAQGVDPFDHDADPEPFTPAEQHLAMHVADLSVAMVKEHRQDLTDQLWYLRKFQDHTINPSTAVSAFQGIAFENVQQQVAGILKRHAAEFGRLQAQFATAHSSKTDLIPPLARYVYHQGDIVPEPLHDVGQIGLARFATRFQQLAEKMYQSNEQYFRKVRGR